MIPYIAIFILVTPLWIATPSSYSSPTKSNKPTQRKNLLINGAGASFPYLLYSKWFAEYSKLHTNIRINYRSIGSGGGIRQFLTGTLDFGATDVPIAKKKMRSLPSPPLHIPTALGAVVISYNLPKLKKTDTLKLTPLIISEIYQGKIKKWNHKKIKKINTNIALPDQQIIPVYRADGSGTTAVLTEYLAHFSKEWLKISGKGKSVNWLAGIGGKGNEGVMGLIRKMPGSIGYIAWSYAAGNRLPTSAVQNSSDHFVKVSYKNVNQSAVQIWNKHHDLFQPLVTAKGKNAYPLAAYTYLLIRKKMLTDKGYSLVKFLKWAMQTGQTFCKSLYYIPLPKAIRQATLKQIKSIQTKAASKK